MPYLARRILLKSLSFVEGKADLSSRVAYVTASINTAVLSAELDDQNGEAKIHKRNAERMLATDRILGTAIPAMDDYDRCVYDSTGDVKIQDPATACLAKKSGAEAEPAVIEAGEIENEKFIGRPEPNWPKATKGTLTPGIVKVEGRRRNLPLHSGGAG